MGKHFQGLHLKQLMGDTRRGKSAPLPLQRNPSPSPRGPAAAILELRLPHRYRAGGKRLLLLFIAQKYSFVACRNERFVNLHVPMFQCCENCLETKTPAQDCKIFTLIMFCLLFGCMWAPGPSDLCLSRFSTQSEGRKSLGFF